MAETFQRPGWYPDPDDGSRERWWNGSGWSDSRRGGTTAAPASPVSLQPATPSAPTPPPAAPPVIYSAGNPPPQRPDPYAQPTLAGSVSQSRSFASIDARVNRNAMIGFITGLIAMFFNVLGVLGIIAIVFSIMGIAKARQLKAQGVTKNLMVFALVGLATGAVATAISAVTLLIFIISFFNVGAS